MLSLEIVLFKKPKDAAIIIMIFELINFRESKNVKRHRLLV